MTESICIKAHQIVFMNLGLGIMAHRPLLVSRSCAVDCVAFVGNRCEYLIFFLINSMFSKIFGIFTPRYLGKIRFHFECFYILTIMLLVEKPINNRCSYAGYFFRNFAGPSRNSGRCSLESGAGFWLPGGAEGLDEGIKIPPVRVPQLQQQQVRSSASLHKLHVPHGCII